MYIHWKAVIGNVGNIYKSWCVQHV